MKGEVHYWQNTLVCYALGANTPFPVMNGFLRRIWKAYSIKILQLQHMVFLVRFNDEESKEVVLRLNNLPFDRLPLIVVPWHKNMGLRSDIHKVLVWVQFPYLPLKIWGTKNLCRLASQLGHPQEMICLSLKEIQLSLLGCKFLWR